MPGEPQRMSPDRQIDRRTFLSRSSALAIAGSAALSMAPGRRHAAAASSPQTARGLLLDMFRIEGEAEPTITAYVETQAGPLIGRAATSGNIYHLRQQQVPASPLGDGIYFAAYQLAGGAALDLESVPSPERHESWHRMALVSYAKMADYGRPAPADDAPDSIMIVLSHPTDVGHDALYNEWYTENHMIEVATSPHFRSATRYRPVAQAGIPLAYLCIYEIEQPYSPQLHEGVMHWLTETPDDFRQAMPTTPAGDGVLTLDIWGYCQRVWSDAAR